MTDKIIPALLTSKRGTAAALASANPVLSAGELCLETDTRKMKAGDGSTYWNNLAYLWDNDTTIDGGDASAVAGNTVDGGDADG